MVPKIQKRDQGSGGNGPPELIANLLGNSLELAWWREFFDLPSTKKNKLVKFLRQNKEKKIYFCQNGFILIQFQKTCPEELKNMSTNCFLNFSKKQLTQAILLKIMKFGQLTSFL